MNILSILSAVSVCFGLLATFSCVSAQNVYGNPDAPLAAEVLGMKIHTGDPDEMKSVILGKLLDRYGAAHDIDVKQAEIDTYVESLHRVGERNRKNHEERRQELARKLKSTSLTDPERKSLSSEVDKVVELLKDTERNLY